ncbi:MAG: orotidine-5'-phosphate decarboxylase [Spirochaetota bacterium]
MHPYIEKLQNQRAMKNSLLCFGMDPVIERMNIDIYKNLADEISGYFSRILDEIVGRITAVKLNLGFYLQYGTRGLEAMEKLARYSRSLDLPVVLDAKSGDVGRTSKAYARFAFEELEADAVTLNPYMGYDSMEPFFSYPDRGFYVLVLTSNQGADLLQLKKLESGQHLFQEALSAVIRWSSRVDSVGTVIGATQKQLQQCLTDLRAVNCSIPILIPGVGAQGGSYTRINRMLENVRYDRGVVRINSSSSISYAHEKFVSFSIEEAAYLAVEETLKS